MISLTVAAVVLGVVVLLELPDKTALAGLMLGARYRASYVFAGVAAAFLLHVALAVAVGSALALLPHRLVQGIVGVLFLIAAGSLLIKKDQGVPGRSLEPADQSFWKVAGNGFTLILVAEFGDLTQIMTANLAARYDDPLSVGIGAVVALWSVAALSIFGSRALTKRLPVHAVTRVAALLMLALAAFSLYEALV
ncbi:TMEM165/GDT1 family protein [Streptomyces iconiensis]|uniref:GDT1 family protein n=1 Tax=Streptomyces iconiensis TaxID=1384038 RepID=A0ABT6ZNN7_9ACTN|nr:TMEM165/GDT1 family protein [Streptomyces iconiensis]MDJ1130656.1 TMEM165/GDT1 family protein [Streptomyces iconiensis]